MRVSFVLVTSLCLSLLSEPASAGLSGSTEARWQVDSSGFEETERYLEQWTALYYQDLETGLRSGVQFSHKADGADLLGKLYQCYLRGGDGNERPELTLGRFETVDSSGYQTLDGLLLRQRFADFGLKAMAGKPRRFEDYQAYDSDMMLGISGDYDLLSSLPMETFESVTLNLGLERQWSSSLQTRLHGGVSGVLKDRQGRTQLSDFHLAADVNLEDGSLYRVMADSHFELNRQGELRLSYAYYDPDDERDTFRERYHGFYSLERQSVVRGIWQLPPMGKLKAQLEVSGSRPEAGAEALGWAAEVACPMRRRHRLDARLDYLEVDRNRAVSLYVRDRLPLSSVMEVTAEGIYQTKETGLSGENQLWGVSLSASRLILKQMRLNLTGEWLKHSDRKVEYRFSFALRYDFYQIDTGELP